MTAQKAGALRDDADKWSSIDWKEAQRQVRRLQLRIAKAVKESRCNKVQALQYLVNPLVLRQATGCETSDLQQGEKDPRR
jgi:RNA-directed DNA polymerase